MQSFKKAKWIWTQREAGKDDYAEFLTPFALESTDSVRLRIACDSVYAAYVNGKLVAFSQCADYPTHKFYDEIDISAYCQKGNELRVLVWHYGENSLIYVNDDAGVIFEISQANDLVLASSKDVLSRSEFGYKNGLCKTITMQLGYSFAFDNTQAKENLQPSRVVQKTKNLYKRPIKLLRLTPRLPVKITKTDEGLLVDMGKETAGYVDLEFESSCAQKITFAYGEHIVDGKVRYLIGGRDFSFDFVAKKGKNSFFNPLRRIAGRYIEVHAESEISVRYIGIRPVYYPVTLIPKKLQNALDQRIYDVSVETLRLCMHEHYEDCPWREQALYTMDSRNQMLCGYYAYEGYEYQRHNLALIAKGLRKDGMLSLCYPAGTDLPIPFFSLAYILQVYEYLEYSKDYSLLEEVGETLDALVHTFEARLDETGLIPRFPYPFWNFYEWNEGGNNGCMPQGADGEKQYDLILNCMYAYVAAMYDKMRGRKKNYEGLLKAVHERFWVESKGVYKLSTDTELYSQLGNALTLLIGLGDERLAEKIVKDENMVLATLSMRAFVYDALLRFKGKYEAFVLADIRERYAKMLDAGATSFWETEKGAADFEGAGSLCHGWSAIPIYYFNKLLG